MSTTFNAAGGSTDPTWLRLVASAATQLLSTQTAAEAARCLFEHVTRALPIDTYVNYLLGDEGTALRLDSCSGVSATAVDSLTEVAMGEQIPGMVARERTVRVVTDVQRSSDPRVQLIKELGLTAYVCCPLIGRHGLVGTLSFGSRTVETFPPQAIDAMTTLVNLAALAIERAVAEERHRRADAELRASRELLTNIVDSSPSSIFARDLEGRLILVNETLARTYETSKEQALGKSYDEIYEKSVAEAIRAWEHRVLADGAPRTFEETLPRDGVSRTFITTKFPVRDHQGRIYGIGGVVTDVTEWKQVEAALRESEGRFRTLADNIAQLAWMADEHGSAFWFNKRWFDFTGTTLDEVAGWGWQRLTHPDHMVRVSTKIRTCVASGRPWEDTFPLCGRDGTFRWFLSQAIPIRDATGTVTRWFGTSTDITDLRQAEEALREADRLKDEFLAMLAHELRNPLAPVRFAVNLLGQDHVDDATKSRARATIDRQVAHLVRLVDDLLDVSRITRNKIELRRERTELWAVVRAAVEATEPLVANARHRLDLADPSGPLWIEADPLRLLQVLTNLLSNAIKFTPPGGAIDVKATADGNQAVIVVRDSGIGMSPEVVPHVFDIFYQGRPTGDGASSGLGLGLTLVKRLVEMHGGTVDAASLGLGKGSSFCIRLPLTATLEDGVLHAGPAVRDAQSADTLRVLVVDDNVDSAEMLDLLVKTMGHETRKATNASDALVEMEVFDPDVALLDIGMPGMNGYELAECIRTRGHATPVLVAITGWGQAEDRRRARDAGFDHHLTKPADPDAIRRLLSTVVKERRHPAPRSRSEHA